jgi:protein ImuA
MDCDTRNAMSKRQKARRGAMIVGLRARIAGIERGEARRPVSLGLDALDAALPEGGLARGAVHGAAGDAAAGFAAMVAGRLDGAVLWCVEAADRAALYGPGLAAFGLDPERLIVVRCRGRTELLWAMEEGLRTRVLAAVIGAPPGAVDLTASRRLQLAAEAGGTLGIVLDKGGAGRFAASALESRWRIDAAPAGNANGLRWRVVLERCRGGAQGAHWMVERDEETGDFAVAAAPADRPAAAPRRRAAR